MFGGYSVRYCHCVLRMYRYIFSDEVMRNSHAANRIHRKWNVNTKPKQMHTQANHQCVYSVHTFDALYLWLCKRECMGSWRVTMRVCV